MTTSVAFASTVKAEKFAKTLATAISPATPTARSANRSYNDPPRPPPLKASAATRVEKPKGADESESAWARRAATVKRDQGWRGSLVFMRVPFVEVVETVSGVSVAPEMRGL